MAQGLRSGLIIIIAIKNKRRQTTGVYFLFSCKQRHGPLHIGLHSQAGRFSHFIKANPLPFLLQEGMHARRPRQRHISKIIDLGDTVLNGPAIIRRRNP